MKIALIARSTLFTVQGGITVQVLKTAQYLRELGVEACVHLTNEKINYDKYDLFHFFDITRPANILHHLKKINKPFVLTPVLIDYSEYDRFHRKGISGFIFGMFSPDTNEYVKSVSRWVLGKDSLPYKNYLFKGQSKSIRSILEKAALILPNSNAELEQLKRSYGLHKPFTVVPNGIDDKIFVSDCPSMKDENLVLCAARIEGIKNQLNLIKALNDTRFRLLLIGEPSQNQYNYYSTCRKCASNNVEFINKVSQEELAVYYHQAKVHVLPSWFETCGLSSLEAAAMGCNIVVSDKGYTREYFGDDAFYCNPEDSHSIFEMVMKASKSSPKGDLQNRVQRGYTWKQTALKTLQAYETIL